MGSFSLGWKSCGRKRSATDLWVMLRLKRCTCCGCFVCLFVRSNWKLELHKGLLENGKWRQRLAESHKSLWRGWEGNGASEGERAHFIQYGESIEDLTRKGPCLFPHNFTLNYTRFVCVCACA